MTLAAVFFAALIVLLAGGLVTWAWFSMAQVEEELRSLPGFEGMDFEIGSQGAEDTESSRWPIPG